MKKISKKRIKKFLKSNENKSLTTSIRIKPSDKEMLVKEFGSIQKAFDAFVRALK